MGRASFKALGMRPLVAILRKGTFSTRCSAGDPCGLGRADLQSTNTMPFSCRSPALGQRNHLLFLVSLNEPHLWFVEGFV